MSAEFIDEFEGIDNQETFFTPAETSLLVYSCIIGITTKAVSSKGGGGGEQMSSSAVRFCSELQPLMITTFK